jgi:hypothetical protein
VLDETQQQLLLLQRNLQEFQMKKKAVEVGKFT